MNPTQIVTKVDEAWRQGFYIVWSRIDGRVRSLGGESLASFPAPPDRLTIRHARTVLIRLWDSLPIEWNLPRVADPPSNGRRGEILPWMAANIPVDDERTLDQFLNLPLAPDQDANWWVRQIQRPMLEDLQQWEELVKELRTKASSRTRTYPKRRPYKPKTLTARQAEILATLTECENNQAKAAEVLGISPAAICKHVKKIGRILEWTLSQKQKRTTAISNDRRGQVNLSSEDDRLRQVFRPEYDTENAED